ncbi:hypothetical protein [Tabrizicola aquatica]|uniref:hypothetical protein n=1 Tax=Tabrizicola aquatica TaxID=909926 RepID=UPI0011AF408D|nr:hypothetical protein [Tabrizicola aquatica]
MKLRSTLFAISLAMFSATGGGAQTAPADASSFTALEAALKGDTWSNALVGVADQISDPYVEFVAPDRYYSSGAYLPFAFAPASFAPQSMNWRQYCEGQEIVEEKIESDWKTIREALQARAETLGVSAEEIRRHDYDPTPDPYLTWRALDDRGLASDSSSKAIFAQVGQFYLEVLGLQIANRLCETTEQEMALGASGTYEAIEIIKASLMIEQLDFIDMAKISPDAPIPADIDHLKLGSRAAITTEEGTIVASSDQFPAAANVIIAALKENVDLKESLGLPENALHDQSINYLASLLLRYSFNTHEYWPHVTQALAEVRPKVVTIDLLTESNRPYGAYDLFQSCALLDGVDLKILNVSAEGEHAAGFTLNDCSLRSLSISNGRIRGLWMNRATVTGAVVLEDLVVQRGLYLNDLKARDVRIENVRAWRTGSTETEGLGGIDNPVEVGLNNAQVDDEIVVRNSSVKDFWASKAQAKVLRMSDSKFSGVVELWGVEGGLLFFKGNQAKELTAWHSHWQTVEIADSDRNVGKIETITMNYLHADGRVYLAQTEIGTARMLSLRAGDIDFQCLRVRNEINLEDARSASFFGLSRIDASKINLKRVRAESLRFYNDDLSGLVASPAGADDAAVPTSRETRTSSLYADGKCQLESTVGVLDLEDAEFDRVRLATTIRQQLFANGAQIGSLIVPGNRSAFDAGANINLRHAEIGSLVLSLGALRPDSANSRQLSFEGATIGGISVFDRDKDDVSITINPTETATKPDIPDHECENRNGQERLRCLYVDELLPALGVTIDGGRFVSQDDGQYSGAVYRTLRAAAEREGYPELGQSLAIIQNDHYAASVASDDFIKSGFYSLGYAINRYGYENSRGVIILLFIWLGGFLILNHAFLLWLVSEPFRRLFPNYFSPEKVAEIDKHDRQSFIVSHIFLSVDRTIPTLGLDNEFAQPAAGQGQKFGPWVLAALYVQRLCAFVVIAFMLGGVFNVFQ